jgi:hypothetical protein
VRALVGPLLAAVVAVPAHAAAPDAISVGGPSAPGEAKVAIGPGLEDG